MHPHAVLAAPRDRHPEIRYGPTDTWGGDEDQGIMGAWNVLVSIGLFSATGACERPARYQLTAPLFDRVTIQLTAGGELHVVLSPSPSGLTA